MTKEDYDEATVQRGYDFLKGFADRRGLGRPSRILESHNAPWVGWDGVGCEWECEGQEPIRNAIADSSKHYVSNCIELRRRLKNWE
jgi:hypothetical protein